jgi:hypothetical protein
MEACAAAAIKFDEDLASGELRKMARGCADDDQGLAVPS